MSVLHLRGRGWLFAQQSPAGTFHLGWSRKDVTLCGIPSLGWGENSVTAGRDYCASCWQKAVRYFPELTGVQEAAKGVGR